MELLHRKSFDTYRVNLHNPYTIFVELNKSIAKFNKKRIKKFDPTITSIVEEATGFLQNTHLDNVFSFASFSKKQAIAILVNTTKNDKDGKYEVRNETKDEQEYRDGASGYHFEIYDTSDDSGKKYGDFYVDKDTGKIYKRNTKTEKLEEYKK